jgi:HAD superfamily phosphatase (TIGR01668 family)
MAGLLKKATKLDRRRVPRLLRRFSPSFRVKRITDIDPGELIRAGYKGVLLDVDNTLLPWKSMHFPPESLAWIESAKAAGLRLCIVSNTRNKRRLSKLSAMLGIPVAEGKMKPSKEGFIDALRIVDVQPGEAIMIGDQMFTDVWGGNRSGIATIWVEPMHPREFFGTKFSRLAERAIARYIRRGEVR